MFQVLKNSRLKEKFRELIMKVVDKKGAKKMWEEIGHLNFIQLEGRLDVPGTALLPDLIQVVFDKTRISFKYKTDSKKRIVSPYFLQQNAQHWYLIAYDHDTKAKKRYVSTHPTRSVISNPVLVNTIRTHPFALMNISDIAWAFGTSIMNSP